MSNVWIGFFVAAGVFAWVYNKMYKNTGGNNTRALSTAAIAGIIVFMTMLIILWQTSDG